jgi:plasmid stabilization system protein ParE
MLPIRWSAYALDRFDALMQDIAGVNPTAAEALADRMESSVLPLSTTRTCSGKAA